MTVVKLSSLREKNLEDGQKLRRANERKKRQQAAIKASKLSPIDIRQSTRNSYVYEL